MGLFAHMFGVSSVLFTDQRVGDVTTSLLRYTTTAILVAFVLQSVLFHSFNRFRVYCITVLITIYIFDFEYIYDISFGSHINPDQWY